MHLILYHIHLLFFSPVRTEIGCVYMAYNTTTTNLFSAR